MSTKTIDIFTTLPNKEKLYIKKRIQEYTKDPLISKNSLSKDISDNTQIKVDRRSIGRIIEYLDIPDKDDKIIQLSRANLSQSKIQNDADNNFANLIKKVQENYSAEELSKLYNSSSMAKMSEIFSVSPYYIRKLLEHFNIKPKKAPTYKEIIEILDNKGITTKDMEDFYLDKENTFNDFLTFLSDNVNYNVSSTSTYRMLRYLNIVKPQDLIAHHQGKKSRKELLDNLAKLKQAGFDTREELAKYYEDNKNLTKQSLAKQLNKNINEEFFTIRWFERHLDPFLSEDRLKGVSRVEKEFQEMVSLVVPSDVNAVFNDWKTISPYQLDILIPELNIAIEFNGNYWHSDKFLMKNHNMTSEEYHTMKSLMCKEKGINLLFVWEYDWYENSDLILQELEKVFQGKKASSILTKKQY